MVRKAMILAAGFGTRLQPLTHVQPKPLVPVCNVPLLGVHLHQLADLGVEEVMINLHHLPEQIEAELGRGEGYGVELSYSLEAPEILGTGGGLNKVRAFFEDEEDFLVLNGDILHGVDLNAAIQRRRDSNAQGTLILREHPGTPGMGFIGVNADGKVCRVPEMSEDIGGTRRAFSGLHVLTPAIFDFLPEGFGCILRTGYRGMLEQGMTVTEYLAADAPWIDIGRPASYLQANLTPPVPQLQQRSRHGVGVVIEEGAEVDENSILGAGVVVRSGAVVQNSVVWAGLEIKAGERLVQKIRYEEGKDVELTE
jgi:NDP-sugar pyrophosphorylase family protein